MSVRDIEVRFASIEDTILTNLGYREYTVSVGETAITPLPEVIQKPLSRYTDGQMQRFIDSMGGRGNPIAIFELTISREVPEATIRNYQYWTITRDGFVAKGLLAGLIVEDARYVATVGVIKVSGALE